MISPFLTIDLKGENHWILKAVFAGGAVDHCTGNGRHQTLRFGTGRWPVRSAGAEPTTGALLLRFLLDDQLWLYHRCINSTLLAPRRQVFRSGFVFLAHFLLPCSSYVHRNWSVSTNNLLSSATCYMIQTYLYRHLKSSDLYFSTLLLFMGFENDLPSDFINA